MSEQHEKYIDPFNPELYRNKIIDIVHIDSVRRVAEGKKPADISDRQQANIVLKRIDALQKAGITFRLIEDLNNYTPPAQTPSSEEPIILGGAFFGQCIAEYQATLTKNNVPSKIDPFLIVRTG